MSAPSWWISPLVSPASVQLFWLTLAGLTAVATLCSPQRRRRLGTLKFAVAHASLIAAPLAGVILVRSGYRAAYLAEGKGLLEAMWLSSLWMVGSILAGGLLAGLLPPTSWLIRDLRQAGRDMWMGRLRRVLGGRA